MTSAGSPSGERFWVRFNERLLGATSAQRARASHSLLATLLFIVFAGIQQFEVSAGLIDQVDSNWLSLYSVAGGMAFFVFVRSGWNLRFTADPSLSFAQCLFGVTAICFSYAITGPARGAIMAIMLLILAFSMFALRPARIHQLSGSAVCMLGTVMLWKGVADPVRYPAAVEITHAMIAVVLMSSISVLSVRMGRLRSLLQRQKADLEHALQQNRLLSTLDELTGLINRRHIGATLRGEHERQRRGGEPMSVALIDIDFFKRVNDAYGHAAGDTVLRAFAQLASKSLRAVDTAARWGGEEFLIVMPSTGTDEAKRVIERLRKDFATMKFSTIDEFLRATFSAGVATHVDTESIDGFIERADQYMYSAKAAGRNRIVAELVPILDVAALR